MEAYLTPAIVAGWTLFIWKDLDGKIDRINEGVDRHLEGQI